MPGPYPEPEMSMEIEEDAPPAPAFTLTDSLILPDELELIEADPPMDEFPPQFEEEEELIELDDEPPQELEELSETLEDSWIEPEDPIPPKPPNPSIFMFMFMLEPSLFIVIEEERRF